MIETEHSTFTQKLNRDLGVTTQLPDFIKESGIPLFSAATTTTPDLVRHFSEQKKTTDAFYVVDLGKVVSQYKRWMVNLPNVEIFYAIKCNADPLILKTLSLLGCGFDVASMSEIASVAELGVPISKIIYSNPIKEPQCIQFAKSKNIDVTVFDNEEELEKIKREHPDCKLVIRIKTDDSKSHYHFSTKYGRTVEESYACIEKAKAMGLSVIGVSFHVGSKCHDTAAYRIAVKDARDIFKHAESIGIKMSVLDLGGGFPGAAEDTDCTFEEQAQIIKESIAKYFSDVKDLRVIAEPGRYFGCQTNTLAANVIGKRKWIGEDGEPTFQYYLNDGMFGSFAIMMHDHCTPQIIALGKENERKYKATVYGPSCSSVDTIYKETDIAEVNIGDWVYVENFGAYTQCLITGFNGFPMLKCSYAFTY